MTVRNPNSALMQWPVETAARICPVFRAITGRPIAPRIPAEMFADLRWMAETPHAVVTMPKPVLATLLDAYECGGIRVIGSLDGIVEDRR